MRFWPASLQSRLMVLLPLALLLTNTLTLSLLFYERMSSAHSVMLGNLTFDVVTSVAILDRLPTAECPQWPSKLARGNHHYLLGSGERGDCPDNWRARDVARSLQKMLSAQYPASIVTISGPRQHIWAYVTLHDGASSILDLWPKLSAVVRQLSAVLIAQLVLLLACVWYAIRQVLLPTTRFTHAVDALEPASDTAGTMAEQGPEEVRRAARALNAMQARIHDHLQERAWTLAVIPHDLQTSIIRMKLRVEMADRPELRDKLLQDFGNMTRLVWEGIAPARTSQPLAEARQWLNLGAFLDTIVCDYVDVGRPVCSCPEEIAGAVWIPPQALRRVMTNLTDNGLKFGTTVIVTLTRDAAGDITPHVLDEGSGIPEASLRAVLQLFYRLENSRNRNTDSTGLGLAIAVQLVSQMNDVPRLANYPQDGLDVSIRLAAAGLYPVTSPAQTDNQADNSPPFLTHSPYMPLR